MNQFWLLFCLTSLSSVAAVYAAYCWYRAQKLLAGASMRSLGQLSMQVDQLQSLYESLLLSHRRVHARIGMRDKRERERLEEEPTVDTATAPPNGDDREKLRVQARARGLMR